jgi:filamentous hemagglutinin family protein
VSKALSSWLGLSLCILGCFCATNNPASAQVTSDDTVNTQVTENGNTAEITGGERAGDNLFHSFQEFSVETGNEASFLNANDISNIFSRVTGGEISNIDGLISANGSANLFLINPAGIVFGEGARLDIGGSFYGSSASSILFEDGEFSATDLENPPLLTINAPIGLGFRDQPGDITVRGNGQGTRATTDLIDTENALRVDSDNTLALVGGKINLDGATIKTPGGRIELGSLQGNQEVRLTPVNEGFSLDYAGVQNFQDIQLSQTASIDASGLVAGDIQVQGNNISLAEGSQIEASTIGDSSSQEIPGTVSINAFDSIKIDGTNLLNGLPSSIGSQVYPDAVGDAGQVTISTTNLALTNAATINANTFGEGNGGNVLVNASESITLDGTSPNGQYISGIGSQVAEDAKGNGGSVEITTTNLALANGATISASTFGEGNGGNVLVNASESITLDAIFIESAVAEGAEGKGGSIEITTTNLALANGATISASTLGEGNGGNVLVNASESITLDASFIESAVSGNATGNGGGLNITTPNLALTNGGAIATSTGGQGDGGSINIDATDISAAGNEEQRSGVFSTVENGATGNSNNIKITADSLSLTNGGQVNANTLGKGNAGNITINATDISFDGIGGDGFASGTFSNVEKEGEGDAGNILIDTKNLSLANGAVLGSSTFNKGNAGNITINATDISFDGTGSDGSASRAVNNVQEGAVGNGGELKIITANLDLTNGGQVNASTLGEGDGGTIDIDATESVTLEGKSGIFNAVGQSAVGNGGTLNITTPNLTLTNGSGILASTLGEGDGGSIFINSTDIALTNGSLIDASNLGGIGNGGSVFVKADTLALDNGTILATNITTESPSANATPKVGGNITLEITKSLSLDNDSNISALATSNANGGNVDINANVIVAFPKGNNDITASAQRRGGNISIASEGIFGIEERSLNDFTNDINASSEVSGFDGTVNINTSDINPVQGATELPSNVVEPEQTTAQACETGRGTANNGLAIAGKGGVTPTPDAPLNSENIINSEQNPAAFAIPEPIETSQGKIQPARGMTVTKSGHIVLTAYPTNKAGERIPEGQINCGQR